MTKVNLKKQIITLRTLLDLTQEELAKELNVSYETINRWEAETNEVEPYNVEKIYTYAFKKKVYFNKISEQLLKEEESDTTKILFHGAKKDIIFPLDLGHSKTHNDFGVGFYLGENLSQAATYVSNASSPRVYAFKLLPLDLNCKTFGVSKEWMLTIAYYRGWLNNYLNNKYLKQLIREVESSDVIIAPIADNRMFDIIQEFVRGEITDLVCEHSLAATNLGKQYVLRTGKALGQTTFLDFLYISQIEKETLVKERLDLNNLSQDKVKLARIEFRGKGKYIDELLK